MPTDLNPAEIAARTFMATHMGEHLSADRARLVERCADHLAAVHGVARESAMQASLRVLGELEARGSAAYVDMSISTSYAVFLRDPRTGTTVAFTAADLLAHARLPHTHACAVHPVAVTTH